MAPRTPHRTTTTSRTFASLAVAAGLVALLAPPVAARTGPDTGYGHVTVPDVTIKASDGTALVGDVMYPADPATGRRADGTFPVLLAQNPYTCDNAKGNLEGVGHASAPPAYYVDRGYIFASVCVRGTGRSGGTFAFSGAEERQDGVDLVHWAVHDLDGSNGAVGLTGCSYLGMNQLFTAAALGRDSGVKAMLPACTGAESYRGNMFAGGVPTQTLGVMKGLGAVMGPRAGEFGAAFTKSVDSGEDKAYISDWSSFRTPGEYARQIADADIPTLLWSGYQDMFAQSALELYTYLQNAHFHRPTYDPMRKGQRTTPRYQVVVGPWQHGKGLDQSVAVDWFDTWLKHKDTGMDRTRTPMRLYETGSDSWTGGASYPMVDSYTPYYLGTSGRLTRTGPTAGADSLAYTAPTAEDGSLTYTTEPFEHGATLAGPVSASLYASTSGTNLQLIARLDDVAPDGTATRLTSGSLVGSLRATDEGRTWHDRRGAAIRPYGTFSADEYLTPGKSYKLSFGLAPRVARLAPGHALRLTVTTQAPAEVCGALTGADPCFPTAPQRKTLPGTYKVHHGLLTPSRIELPLRTTS